MVTQWKKWMPKEGLKNKYYIDKINDDIENGLTIELKDEDGNKVFLNWDGVIISYTCSLENARYILCDNEELTRWPFFEAENSEYMRWLGEQSLGIYEDWKDMHHFCIIGIDFVVDVVTTYYPNVY